MSIENALKLSDKIYNISFILSEYCTHKGTCEELQNLKPIVEHLHNLSDELNSGLETLKK